ncbi:RNA polymerase II subunit A C-terminal domain phosphatase [Medicago truncatula]|uniref:RNA polymerase II subunit A C-terminal domain phosphatase n=1 Tax=Medicago truncatula TaxID=3880 RepID=UPI000D2F3A43|nr:RNA polymerase II subunit A C-terminal domain phosphatase [Medicago truncatula]
MYEITDHYEDDDDDDNNDDDANDDDDDDDNDDNNNDDGGGGQEKRKLQFTTSPKNSIAACLKDGKVLRKFWGDEDTDSTLEPEDIEVFPPDADKFLATPLEIGKFTKPGRKSRKHKSPNEKGSGGITSSENIQTRSKKGVIKSNLKYV